MALPAAAVARPIAASAASAGAAANGAPAAGTHSPLGASPAATPGNALAPATPDAGATPPAERAIPELFTGMRVGRCVVVSAGPVVAGGLPVVLKSPDGSLFGVDVLGYDPMAPGVSRAGSLAVYLNNGGTGRKASVEEHGLAAMALGAWLARRESLGRAVPSLLTLRQRAPLLAAARR